MRHFEVHFYEMRHGKPVAGYFTTIDARDWEHCYRKARGRKYYAKHTYGIEYEFSVKECHG